MPIITLGIICFIKVKRKYDFFWIYLSYSIIETIKVCRKTICKVISKRGIYFAYKKRDEFC